MKAHYSNKLFSGATTGRYNHSAPHMHINRSVGSLGQSGYYRNEGRGYQPIGSQYTFRSSHPVSCTSYGDRHTHILFARPTTSSHCAMEVKVRKSTTRCNYCGRIGHWWQECLDRHHGRPIRAHPADALPLHHSSSPDDFSHFSSYISALDIKSGSHQANSYLRILLLHLISSAELK